MYQPSGPIPGMSCQESCIKALNDTAAIIEKYWIMGASVYERSFDGVGVTAWTMLGIRVQLSIVQGWGRTIRLHWGQHHRLDLTWESLDPEAERNRSTSAEN